MMILLASSFIEFFESRCLPFCLHSKKCLFWWSNWAGSATGQPQVVKMNAPGLKDFVRERKSLLSPFP
jgi:hypothetical protein